MRARTNFVMNAQQGSPLSLIQCAAVHNWVAGQAEHRVVEIEYTTSVGEGGKVPEVGKVSRGGKGVRNRLLTEVGKVSGTVY
jgi:hypothetical protein